MKRSFTLSSLLIIVFSTFLLISCKKNIDTIEPIVPPGDAFAIPAASPVTGSVSGLVVNENNIPVNGALVSLGTASVTTNAKGIFNFNNATLDKYISTVTVNVNGYFKAYRSFSATAGRNVVSIKLIPKQLSGTVSSSASGDVTLTNGTKLSFQANSVKIKSTGAAYTGTVNVYASYIDPTAADIGTRVPGSFIGEDENNLYSLQSTGMIAVELESASGEPLQLVTDKPATIMLPIPSSLLDKAPASIDTWSLNDKGVWIQESTATKSGNFYEMHVTHFSFWNCDVPANAIYLTLNVVDQNGSPLANTEVQLTIPGNTTWWASTYGFTNNLGVVSGLVPAGIALQMNIYPNPYTCSVPANSQSIGPFTANTTLTVTATIPTAQTLTVSGTATDCSNAPLQNGTAIINIDQYTHIYTSVTNGTYTATVTHCSAITSLDVTILDSSTSTIASSGTVAVSGNTVTVPNITVCGGTPNAIFTFGTQSGNCVATYSGSYTEAVPLNANNIVLISVNVTALGSYLVNTPTVNGISFSGTGVFTGFGTQTVALTGTGTPTAAGSFSYQAQAAGATGCPFNITVGNPQGGQAIFTWGSGGVCQSTVVGTYTVGVPLDSNMNQIAVIVTVSTPGTYYISTSTVNGISFYSYGTFTQTGTQTVTLGGSGTPLAAGASTYLLSANGGVSGCTVIVNTTANPNATFTFAGAPGTCSGVVVSGTYTAGTPLNVSQNTVTLTVNVTTPGSYSISTNTTNGIFFADAGTFTTPGVQTISLEGNGTPLATALNTFIPQAGGGITGCIFTVQIN